MDLFGIMTYFLCALYVFIGMNVGGYFCPCHGSHYDASGRVTDGPAPKNLEVPSYEFTGSNTIFVQ